MKSYKTSNNLEENKEQSKKKANGNYSWPKKIL